MAVLYTVELCTAPKAPAATNRWQNVKKGKEKNNKKLSPFSRDSNTSIVALTLAHLHGIRCKEENICEGDGLLARISHIF